MTRDEAAAALNIKAKEVADVEDSPAGPVITTTDGVRYVIVPEDQPDANGKTGLMFLAAPNLTGDWPMPIYSQPGAVDTDPDNGVDNSGADSENAQASDPGAVDTDPVAAALEAVAVAAAAAVAADPEPSKGKGIRSKAD